MFQRGSIALDSQIGGAGGHAGAAFWWAARANRIEEALHRLETSSKEMCLAKHKAEAHVDLRDEMLRDVNIWQCRVDFELGLMAEIIFTESTAEERMCMPAEWHEKPVQLFKWVVGEAKFLN